MAGLVVQSEQALIVAAAQQGHEPDLTTALFNEDVLPATSLFIVAFCACRQAGYVEALGARFD